MLSDLQTLPLLFCCSLYAFLRLPPPSQSSPAAACRGLLREIMMSASLWSLCFMPALPGWQSFFAQIASLSAVFLKSRCLSAESKSEREQLSFCYIEIIYIYRYIEIEIIGSVGVCWLLAASFLSQMKSFVRIKLYYQMHGKNINGSFLTTLLPAHQVLGSPRDRDVVFETYVLEELTEPQCYIVVMLSYSHQSSIWWANVQGRACWRSTDGHPISRLCESLQLWKQTRDEVQPLSDLFIQSDFRRKLFASE